MRTGSQRAVPAPGMAGHGYVTCMVRPQATKRDLLLVQHLGRLRCAHASRRPARLIPVACLRCTVTNQPAIVEILMLEVPILQKTRWSLRAHWLLYLVGPAWTPSCHYMQPLAHVQCVAARAHTVPPIPLLSQHFCRSCLSSAGFSAAEGRLSQPTLAEWVHFPPIEVVY